MPDEIVQDQSVAAPDADSSLLGIMSEEAGGGDDAIDTGWDDDNSDTDTPAADGGDATMAEGASGGEAPAAEPEGSTEPDPRDAAVQQLQQLNESFANDPAGFIQSLLAGLDPSQQAAILGNATGDATVPAELEADYEPQSRFEEVFAPVLKDLPRTITGHVTRGVEEGLGRMIPYVDHANIATAIASAQIGALADMLGVTLPRVDVSAIAKAASTGKTTYAEAVERQVGAEIKAAVAAAKQAKAKRPDPQPTVTQQIDGLTRNARGQTSLQDIMRAIGAK